ncbi:MAG: eukaryotic-like serine/threonine-protein kinase [Kribbellaceae bacterium]|nr:eukaryotic-like serine/threonine-protein kinase [Kribbellaceae bacterium]
MDQHDGPAATERLIAGRYLLAEPLGSGGMGSVWRATDQQLGRVVALKRAHPGLDDPDGRRLRREAKIGARLHDPHVVTIFDVVTDGADHWLVLEYLPSRTLSELIVQRGTLPPAEVTRIGLQIAQAVQAVHAAKVIHRDIKPGNILVTEDGTAKLADFGISQRLWAEATLTDSSTVGTPAQLAPEVANGDEPTPASDVFSLGAVLYTAVEGHSPFGTDPNPLAVLRKAARGEILPMRRAGELAPLITRMLRVDPAARPTAVQVVAELGGPAAPLQTPKRRWWIAAAAAGVAVVVVALVMTNAFSGTARQQPQAEPIPGPPPTTAAPQLDPVGDALTVDPCALIDPKPLERFGETTVDTDYGNFGRCDVVVQSGQREVDVRAELEAQPTPDLPPPGTVEKHAGNVTAVARQRQEDDACERVLVLSDHNRIRVAARYTEGSGGDLCAMAETATKKAVSVLSAGPIPRRTEPLDAASLARVDACSLLDAKALSIVPGLDISHPDVGFGNWECDWDSTTSDASVQLRFDRNQPLTAADGQPTKYGNRSAFVEPEGEGPGTCVVKVVHRTYADPNDQTAVELVQLVVSGPGTTTELCRLTTQLARAAAGRLPRG